MPIRPRVALTGATIVALTLLLFSMLIFALARAGQRGQQETLLRERAAAAATLIAAAAPDILRPRASLTALDLRASLEPFVLVTSGEETLSTTARLGDQPLTPALLGLPAGSPQRDGFTIAQPEPGLRLRLWRQPWQRPDLGQEGWIISGQSQAKLTSDLRGLRAFLWISGLISLGVALAAMWFVLGRALRPLVMVSAAAQQIAATGDVSRRLPVDGPRDEMRRLSESFNAMLERLQATYRRLAATVEAQRRFVADASHELRTPLTTIRANAGFLVDNPEADGDDRRLAIEDIAAESERMSRLATDLLTLARADAGLHLERRSLNLAELAREVSGRARRTFAGRTVTTEIDDDAPVSADREALTRLAWILLDNADKHTPAGTPITIFCGARGGMAVLQVSDSGPGLPEDALTRVFERFYQADPARKAEGAGLGLAIAAWVVEQHGGVIRAYNRHGGGAAFRVELPLLSEPPSSSAVPAEAAS